MTTRIGTTLIGLEDIAEHGLPEPDAYYLSAGQYFLSGDGVDHPAGSAEIVWIFALMEFSEGYNYLASLLGQRVYIETLAVPNEDYETYSGIVSLPSPPEIEWRGSWTVNLTVRFRRVLEAA